MHQMMQLQSKSVCIALHPSCILEVCLWDAFDRTTCTNFVESFKPAAISERHQLLASENYKMKQGQETQI